MVCNRFVGFTAKFKGGGGGVGDSCGFDECHDAAFDQEMQVGRPPPTPCPPLPQNLHAQTTLKTPSSFPVSLPLLFSHSLAHSSPRSRSRSRSLTFPNSFAHALSLSHPSLLSVACALSLARAHVYAWVCALTTTLLFLCSATLPLYLYRRWRGTLWCLRSFI